MLVVVLVLAFGALPPYIGVGGLFFLSSSHEGAHYLIRNLTWKAFTIMAQPDPYFYALTYVLKLVFLIVKISCCYDCIR